VGVNATFLGWTLFDLDDSARQLASIKLLFERSLSEAHHNARY